MHRRRNSVPARHEGKEHEDAAAQAAQAAGRFQVGFCYVKVNVKCKQLFALSVSSVDRVFKPVGC